MAIAAHGNLHVLGIFKTLVNGDNDAAGCPTRACTRPAPRAGEAQGVGKMPVMLSGGRG
jgi:hypothetical protein